MKRLVYLSFLLILISIYLTSADETKTGSIKNTLNGIEVRIENAVKSVDDHQPGQRGLVSSAVRGLGRLIKNVTLESGQYVRNVASGAVNLVKHTARAGMETVSDSANRLRGNYMKQNDASNQPIEAATEPNELQNANPDVKVEAGAAPNELTNIEVNI